MASTINASTTLGLISSADISGVLQLQTANTTAVTIDASQNVGVGMTPVYKLDVTGGNGNAIRFTDSVNSVQVATGAYNSTGFIGTLSNHPQLFYTNGAERMRVDTAGNFGLGVTPQTWNSGYKVLQFSSGGALYGATGDVYLGNNVYANSADSNTYITTNFASMYRQNGGKHIFYTSASGTAGASISFTEALTLQNVSQANLTLRGTNASMLINSTNGVYPGIFIQTSGTTFAGMSGDGTNFNIGANGYLAFQTSNLSTERARFDISGRFEVGASSGVSTWPQSASAAGQQKFQIESSGIANITTNQTTGAFRVNLNNGAGDFTRFYLSGTQIGSISGSGSTTTYSTSSDYRLKNITGALTGYKERLMSLLPKQGTWKLDGSEFRGFLAHEFANPYRASVTGEKDAVDADGNPIMQGMQASSSEVMADLVAMIQEQNQIIQQLQADVAALKG